MADFSRDIMMTFKFSCVTQVMIQHVRLTLSASDILFSRKEVKNKDNLSSPFWSEFWPLCPTSFCAGLAWFACLIVGTGQSSHWNLYSAGRSSIQYCQGMLLPWPVSKFEAEKMICALVINRECYINIYANKGETGFECVSLTVWSYCSWDSSVLL